jgi:hypothetical protein
VRSRPSEVLHIRGHMAGSRAFQVPGEAGLGARREERSTRHDMAGLTWGPWPRHGVPTLGLLVDEVERCQFVPTISAMTDCSCLGRHDGGSVPGWRGAAAVRLERVALAAGAEDRRTTGGGNSLEWVTSSPPPHHGGAAGRTSDSNCFLTRGFQVVIKVRQCPPDDLPEASRAVTPSCIPRSCRQPVHPAPPPFAAP